MPNKKTIFFDFDGVIMDSFAHAFDVSSFMHPTMSEDEYRQAFEGNINDTEHLTHKCADDCKKDFDFFGAYAPKVKESCKIFEGIDTVVKDLSQRYRLAIISSTETELIKELLLKFELHECFQDILGNDVHTSKVEKIKMLFNEYQIESDDCLFITDTLGDLREAEKMGVKKVAVVWGFHGRETLEKGEPLIIANSPTELREWVTVNF